MQWYVVKVGSIDCPVSDMIWVEFLFRGQAREVLHFRFDPLRLRMNIRPLMACILPNILILAVYEQPKKAADGGS